MRFGTGVTFRHSQRGLVVSSPSGATLLVEHERANDIPELLAQAAGPAELTAMLGGSTSDQQLTSDLVEERIISGEPGTPDADHASPCRMAFTRSGLEFTGIDGVARLAHRMVMPILTSWWGRAAVAAVLIGGVIALASGRPEGPAVSQHPWVDATLGLTIGLVSAALHELAHAVALVHYGRTPRRAGAGFYWGALCFYVDSSDGMTLPRRARVVNALAGLAVNLIVAALLLIVANVTPSTLITSVCWRVAVLELVGVIENGLPILEVDGHIALSDYLDEPDLGPRSRDALSRRIRGSKQREQPSWLAAYGAFSLIGGIVLLATSTWIWWLAAGDMITALFGGNVAEMLLGLYVVVPFAIAVVFSAIGLVIELLASAPSADTAGVVEAAPAPAQISKPIGKQTISTVSANRTLDQERSGQDDSSDLAPVDPDAVQALLTMPDHVNEPT